ncbi:MAG: DUF981 domain-containing protein [Cyanobacteria bacterium P01_H01_bin.152]
MFINYITLMLTNLVAGLVLLAAYVYWGLDDDRPTRWIPGFGVVGAIALVTGLHMTFTWPVIGSYNIAYGEASVLYGILFAGAAVALAQRWELITLAIYGFFAGVYSLVLGVRIINLGLTLLPFVSGLGFILAGLGGVCASPMLHFSKSKPFRLIGAILLVLAALIFAWINLFALWGHMADYGEWQPLPMR